MYTEKQIEEFKMKADKWDALEKEVGEMIYSNYGDDDADELIENEDDDVSEIGLVACRHLGFE